MQAMSVAEPRPHPVVGIQLVRWWPVASPPPTAEMVLVHGICDHTGRYERAGSLLAGAGLAVTGADLIGWGLTGGRRGYTRDWVQYLDQVQNLMEEASARGGPRILFGHSMGGLLALEYALSERPRPDLLVLSAPALQGGSRWQKRLAAALAPIVPILSLPTLIRGEQLSRDPAVGEEYFRDPLVHRAMTVRLGRLMFQAMERTRAAVPGLTIPTLVLHGGDDSIVPPSCTVELGSLPVAERWLYPGLRHEILNEPEGPEVVGDVIDWIWAHL